MIGSMDVLRAPPDGYTLLCHASSQVYLPLVVKKKTYDAEKDFTAIAQIGYVPLAVVTYPKFEANNFKRRFGDFRDTVSLAKTVKFVFENMYDEHKCQLFPWFPGKLPIQFHNQLDTMLDTNHFFIRYTTTLTIEQAHFILLINIKDTLLKFPIKRRNDGAFEVDGFRRFQTMTHIFESFPEMVRILQLQFSNMQPMDVSDLHIIGKGEISKKR